MQIFFLCLTSPWKKSWNLLEIAFVSLLRHKIQKNKDLLLCECRQKSREQRLRMGCSLYTRPVCGWGCEEVQVWGQPACHSKCWPIPSVHLSSLHCSPAGTSTDSANFKIREQINFVAYFHDFWCRHSVISTLPFCMSSLSSSFFSYFTFNFLCPVHPSLL